jgi:hypothetical protein
MNERRVTGTEFCRSTVSYGQRVLTLHFLINSGVALVVQNILNIANRCGKVQSFLAGNGQTHRDCRIGRSRLDPACSLTAETPHRIAWRNCSAAEQSAGQRLFTRLRSGDWLTIAA